MYEIVYDENSKRNVYPLKLKVRDMEHLFSILGWLNDNVGFTADTWFFDKPPIDAIRRSGKKPVVLVIYITADKVQQDFKAKEAATYLSLL